MKEKTTLGPTQTTHTIFDIIKTGISFQPRNLNESRKNAHTHFFSLAVVLVLCDDRVQKVNKFDQNGSRTI